MSDPARTTEPERLLLTQGDVMKALGICEGTLRDLRRRGLIRAVKIGRAVRFDVRDVRAFIDANKEQPADEPACA